MLSIIVCACWFAFYSNLGSAESLIKKVKDLEQLSGTIMGKLGATKVYQASLIHCINSSKIKQVDVATELSAISRELKKMVPVLSMHQFSGTIGWTDEK